MFLVRGLISRKNSTNQSFRLYPQTLLRRKMSSLAIFRPRARVVTLTRNCWSLASLCESPDGDSRAGKAPEP